MPRKYRKKNILLLLVFPMILLSCSMKDDTMNNTKNTSTEQQELVVLLHGILRSKTDMLLLTKFFEKHGYVTLNILYPSREKKHRRVE